jgi:hypothetical protein
MKTITAEDILALEENILELELRMGLEGMWPGAEAQIRLERQVLARAQAELAAQSQAAVS